MGDNPELSHVGSFDYNSMIRDCVASSMRWVFLDCYDLKFFSNATTTRRTLISASESDSFGHHYDGKMVDENMILLRMRIREIEMMEMKGKTPSDWCEWEKENYENYVSDVCEALGLLQRLLINTRPSLALATIVLIILIMSMPIVQLLLHLVAFAKGMI
ncbi:hypothetical protein VNO80_16984 [Phaseolus coccineus]|uniref:Uncharacterized protein n=1 Tax=Phaseolus coccineus TaxID=3886 RepID=A0AAN9MN47_PHACN